MLIQSKTTTATRPVVRSWPDFHALHAEQRPGWTDGPELRWVRSVLALEAPLVEVGHIETLRSLLAEVAAGRLQIIQAGDCAEDPAESTVDHLERKVGLLQALAGVMQMNTGIPVMCVGRIAGQFAKPRSAKTERCDGVDLPVYRGPMVNSPDPYAEARRPDPLRMLSCYRSAATMMHYLNGVDSGRSAPRVWTSHEALVLDYETPQLRQDDGKLMLTSTHWPWVGERTRHPYGAHIALLSAVSNPVACKVGPDASISDVLELCERLDPRREPGRLTLIARLGAGAVAESLPPLVSAVRNAGHPVIWLCDPMHANTVLAPGARKTRLVSTVLCEVLAFQRAVADSGGVAGGLHLEATPWPVTECAMDEAGLGDVGRHYTTLCDPRLNAQQALAIASAWSFS